jgi:NADH dehydrogenase
MRVLVIGGTGLVGSAVVHALRTRGHTVRVVTRHPPPDGPARIEGTEYLRGDITVAASLQGAADGCAAVVHVAGVAQERRARGSYQGVNIEGTRHVLAEAHRAGVPFIVYVSALGAERGLSAYHRSQRHAEMLVREYPGRWLVLRPGNVYGRGEGLIALYLRMVRRLPMVPGVGDVDQRLQPISAVDLGEVVSRAVERRDLAGRTFEIAGPDTTSQRELHRLLGALVDRRPRLVVLPAWSIRLGIRLLTALRLDPPIGIDQVTMLQEGNVLLDGKRSAVREVFGVEPLSLHDGLRRLLRDAPGAGRPDRPAAWIDTGRSPQRPETPETALRLVQPELPSSTRPRRMPRSS